MRSIAPPAGASLRKNSICFSSKSIGFDQPLSVSLTSFDEKERGPKLTQSPVDGCSRRALVNEPRLSLNRLEVSLSVRLAFASLRLRLVFVPSARVRVD